MEGINFESPNGALPPDSVASAVESPMIAANAAIPTRMCIFMVISIFERYLP